MPRPPDGFWFRVFAQKPVRVHVPKTVFGSYRDAERARLALNRKDPTGLALWSLSVSAYRTKAKAKAGQAFDAFDEETGRLPLSTEVMSATRSKAKKAKS